MRRAIAAALFLYLAAVTWIACSTRAQEQTGQPLVFSHRIHVAQFKMDCQYCHVYARRGPVAGLPSVQRCVQCHFAVVNDRPEIARLMQFWERREPIPWVRIHRLPEHAQFDHQRHVLGGVACATCHGDVSRMDAAVQVAPLTMGWCLTCHDGKLASRDCVICHH